MSSVSILIPTFRRPEGFARAARGVFAQNFSGALELCAVDNSPEGSALETFRALERETTIPFRWAHAPKPGVAHARNAALALAQGHLIAWLDDDEEAPPHWLAALVAVQCQTDADSVFGPVIARAPEHALARAYVERLYARTGPAVSGPCDTAHGIGNSLQPRAFFTCAAPFAASADQTGGEDDLLFAAARASGARFAWAAEAGVIEHVAPARATLGQAFKRAFAYGQGPCETAWAQRDVLALARHMGIGAAQAAAFSLAAFYAYAARHPAAIDLADRAVRGAGKVLWFHQQRFYGETLARQSAGLA